MLVPGLAPNVTLGNTSYQLGNVAADGEMWLAAVGETVTY